MGKADRILKQYLWQYGGNDPRYRNFLMAAGITGTEIEKQTLYTNLLKKHGERIDYYKNKYDMYVGNHWFNVSDDEINPKKVNFCELTINKHASFLMNKGFLVESDFPEIERFLQHNHKLNNLGEKENNLLGLQIAINGGIAGNTWVHVGEDNAHPITGEKYIKYKLFENMKSFPVLDRNELRGFLYYGEEEFVARELNGFAEYDNRFAGYYYTAGQTRRLIDEQLVNIEAVDIPEIPIVNFSNFTLPISYYGYSDLTSIEELNTLYDKILTDVQDILDYHAAPVTLLYGARGQDLIKGANKVWSLPKDAKMENLKLDGELTAIESQMNRVRESIGELSGIPINATGKQQAISNTSAAAIAITFMPLFEVMERKRLFYGVPMLKLNSLVIKMGILSGKIDVNKVIKNAIAKWNKDFGNYDEDTKAKFYPFSQKIDENKNYNQLSVILNNEIPVEIYQTYLTWFPPLPREEKIATDLSIANVNNKLWSRRHGRSVIGMSEKESILMEKEIEKEFERDKEIGMVTITNKPLTDGKTGLEGDPNIKGNKESQRVENKV